jgi:uncharacterized protein (TIGR03086 family)
MDAFEALDVSSAQFRRLLLEVRPDQMSLPTPCAGWSVRDLLNHVVGGEKRYILLLRGAPTAVVEATRDADHLSPAPAVAYDELHADLMTSFRKPGVLATTVHHRAGDRRGSDLLLMRTVEYALHGWDLATAIDAGAAVDGEVVEFLLEEMTVNAHVWEGIFVPVEATAATAQDRLLLCTGREPRKGASS